MKQVLRVKKTLLCILLGSLVVGCSTPTNIKQDSEDILTQKKTAEGRTQITMLTKRAFSLANFEREVEAEFDDIDLILVNDYAVDAVAANGFEARIKNDDLTDIVFTWPYETGQEYWEERLIDLSGIPFTNKYKVSMLDSLTNEKGNLYYLPGPASIRGIVYNKTMFIENGWEVPQSYSEFTNLCKTIEASGYRAFQLPLWNGEVLDTAFIGINYGNAFSNAEDADWLSEYNKGNGSFLDHFDAAIDSFQMLTDDGIIKESDLELSYADTQDNLFKRKIVMTEDSIQLIKLANTAGGSSDEFAIMPFFNQDPENTWARLYMCCFIGMNQHLLDKGNEDKYDKVIKVMEYISTPEGQEALTSGNGTMFSSLKDKQSPMDKELVDMRTTLEQGRYGVFPTLKRSQSALREGLRGLLKGTMNKSEVGALVDELNANPLIVEEEIYGRATEDFTYIETGSFVADITRKAADSEIALVLDGGRDGYGNNRGINAKIYEGDIDNTELRRILPDYRFKEAGEIWKIEMTGENLIKTLEFSVELDGVKGWFYYVSGLKLTFDPLAERGSRIKSIETSDGSQIDSEKIYTIAVTEGCVPDEFIISTEKTGLITKDEIIKELQIVKEISPIEDERFVIAK